MARKLQLANVLAAVIVIAAFAVPSLATAHEGHAHHTATVQKAAPATSQTQLHEPAAAKATANVASLTAARGTDASGAARSTDGCASHCCGGSAGMTCCGAALAPDLFWVALYRASVPFAARPDLPPSGLPPEALPKPPKSFA
jgi:hypothetical protein